MRFLELVEDLSRHNGVHNIASKDTCQEAAPSRGLDACLSALGQEVDAVARSDLGNFRQVFG
jgi:hypothetical protein